MSNMSDNFAIAVADQQTAIQRVDPAAVAAAETAKAKIQAAFMVALHRPRSVATAAMKLKEACKRPKFAEQAEYRIPIAGKTVSGPSIRFAEEALRSWGNFYDDKSVVYEDEKTRRIKVSVTDLETNATFSKEITISKTIERKDKNGRGTIIDERINSSGQKIYIVAPTDAELAKKEAAEISKVLRNEGLRLIPQDIVDDALETARSTLLNDTKTNIVDTRKKLVEKFWEKGVRPEDLAKYLGHPVETVTAEEIVDLRKVYSSIESGETKFKDFIDIESAPVVEPKVASTVKPVVAKGTVPVDPKVEKLLAVPTPEQEYEEVIPLFDAISYEINSTSSTRAKSVFTRLSNEIAAGQRDGELTEDQAVELNQQIKDRLEEI